MDPYAVLSVEKNATLKNIRSAYRVLSSEHHPDRPGGSREKFEELKLAHDILTNPERRKRYDTTGRIDLSPITPQRVQLFIDATMRTVITATRPDGSTDDPVFHNIRDKIVLSILGSRVPLRNAKFKLQRELERAQRMIERFKPRNEWDPIGEALKKERDRIENELRINEDAMELSIEAERVLKTYDYEVGPGPEGHFSPGPTRPRRGPALLT